MLALRILRVIFIVAGLGVAILGLVMIAAEAKVSGGTVGAQWTCEADSAVGGMRCQTNGGSYSGPGGLVDVLGWLGLSVGGLTLIGAAIALGQFDRPRVAAAPGPMQSGHAPQPMQGGPSPGRW
jgi:hypothetical protein